MVGGGGGAPATAASAVFTANHDAEHFCFARTGSAT